MTLLSIKHAFVIPACMLYTYSTLMALILCVEIGLAVTIYIFKGDARDFVSNAMQKGMQNYDAAAQSEHAGVTETWNIVQVCIKIDGTIIQWGLCIRTIQVVVSVDLTFLAWIPKPHCTSEVILTFKHTQVALLYRFLDLRKVT